MKILASKRKELVYIRLPDFSGCPVSFFFVPCKLFGVAGKISARPQAVFEGRAFFLLNNPVKQNGICRSGKISR